MKKIKIISKDAWPESLKLPFREGRVLINGKILKEGFETRKVYSACPVDSNGTLGFQELGTTPKLSQTQFQESVEAAVKAWDQGRGSWATARMEERITAVANFCEDMKKSREEVCKLLMLEIAKSWVDSLNEFDRTIKYIEDTIEEVKQMDQESSRIRMSQGIMAQIRRAPLGVTLCMGPFNYPLNETFTTLIPALIMGNPVVAKIPRFGQLLWDPLLEAFQKNFPAGVINIVNGEGRTIVNPTVQTGKIDVLAFIGSSTVANKIKISHPRPHRFRSILGLDAKNPAVILKDANIPLAVQECVKGTLSFNGQRCTALKILFVQKSVSQKFCDELVKAVDNLKIGYPWEEKVAITPLADPQKPEYLKALIEDALQKGGNLLNEGGVIEHNFFFPVIVKLKTLDCRLALEEQFAPVIPIFEYENLHEVENYIVHSEFGMQASIFGEDPKEVGRLIDRLSNQVCRINLNSQCQRGPDVFPFTGRKSSAEGTLSVYDALRSFSIRSMVAVKQDSDGKKLVRKILESDSSHFLSNNFVL